MNERDDMLPGGGKGKARVRKVRVAAVAAVSCAALAAGLWYVMGLLHGRDTRDVVVKPTSGTFEVTVTCTGELQAVTSTKIVGPATARMVGIYQMRIAKLVPEGTRVKTGDFVAELDKGEISNTVKNAETDLEKALSRYEQVRLDTTLTLTEARSNIVNIQYRVEEMQLRRDQASYEAPAVKRQAELDHQREERALAQAKEAYETKVQQAIARMKEAAAELTQRRQRYTVASGALKEFTIVAPAEGIVIYEKEWNGTKKNVNSQVSAWDPSVASLPDLSRIESVTWVNEIDIQKVKVGQEADIELDADPGKKLQGKVTHVSTVGEQRPNSDSKVFEVKIEVAGADSSMLPGMTTSNTVHIAQTPGALWLPLECLHTRDSVTCVFKKSGLGLVRQEVLLGLTNDNDAVIAAGVEAGDEVLLSMPGEPERYQLIRLARPAEGTGG